MASLRAFDLRLSDWPPCPSESVRPRSARSWRAGPRKTRPSRPRKGGGPMVPPYDRWVLRRVLAGLATADDLRRVSSAFRPLAEHLASLPLENRMTGYYESLGGRDDAAAIN